MTVVTLSDMLHCPSVIVLQSSTTVPVTLSQTQRLSRNHINVYSFLQFHNSTPAKTFFFKAALYVFVHSAMLMKTRAKCCRFISHIKPEHRPIYSRIKITDKHILIGKMLSWRAGSLCHMVKMIK